MCFAPLKRALFRHLNFQKCSDNEVFFAFWLQHVLRATTVCNFSSLISPDGSAPAALASLLSDPPKPQNMWKTHVSRLFYLFAHLDLLSSDSFSSLIFFLLTFSSLTLPTSTFPSVHIVGSLTSKLPSIIVYIYIYIYLETLKTKFSVRTGWTFLFVLYVFFPNTAMSGCKPSTYRLI